MSVHDANATEDRLVGEAGRVADAFAAAAARRSPRPLRSGRHRTGAAMPRAARAPHRRLDAPRAGGHDRVAKSLPDRKQRNVEWPRKPKSPTLLIR